MFTTRRLITCALLTLILCLAASAQEERALLTQAPPPQPAATSIVTAAATDNERVRFVAGNDVTQLNLEIYTEAGQKIFETGWQKGNVLDWRLVDAAGQRVADGSYLAVLSSRSLAGKASRRIGSLSINGEKTAVQTLTGAQLSAAQRQAIGTDESDASLTDLPGDATPSVTALTHDGKDGQLNRTDGALSFRAGDFYSGKDQEQMRLTAEGNLGIGTDSPEARLDVNGAIRARSGFQFADGSVLNLAPQGGLSITSPEGRTTGLGTAPNAINGTANRLPKFDTNGSSLLDSTLYQDPNTGFIGWGTTTPAHPFVVRRNGGSMGMHSIGELFVDRDNNSRSASLTVGTAGQLKWIFGMPSGGDGFQVYDLTNNVSRFFINPTNGNAGIGTTTPAAKLDVVGSINTSSQYNIDGTRALIASGTNLIAGTNAGPAIIVGSENSFFGQSAGDINTGDGNSYFGWSAGAANTSGNYNSFFGTRAGILNTEGFENSFFGWGAGQHTTVGTVNAFFGYGAGNDNTTGVGNTFIGSHAGFNTTGSHNTALGDGAGVTQTNLNYATAIGADAKVSISNSIALGRSDGSDTVRIPGTLIVSGNVAILGNLAKGGGSFQIDHPLDPANKYLYHSFVESPDMMNVYNGNIVTDKRGLVVVTLPAYFEALNRDFRYQLTVVGQFAQAIVAHKIAGNRFVIQTNKPRVEVSWQVTGIRRDPYANANRIQVEVDKGQERGTYLHPQLFPPATSAARMQEK